jgi:hypothetical protein
MDRLNTRNAIMDARSPFDPEHPPFRLNQFGSTLGGRCDSEQDIFSPMRFRHPDVADWNVPTPRCASVEARR